MSSQQLSMHTSPAQEKVMGFINATDSLIQHLTIRSHAVKEGVQERSPASCSMTNLLPAAIDRSEGPICTASQPCRMA
jgi:hypothetical protein